MGLIRDVILLFLMIGLAYAVGYKKSYNDNVVAFSIQADIPRECVAMYNHYVSTKYKNQDLREALEAEREKNKESEEQE